VTPNIGISGWKAQLYSPLDEMVYDFKTLYAVISDGWRLHEKALDWFCATTQKRKQ